MARDVCEDGDGDEPQPLTARQKAWSICPVCHGEGKHVNPNIDSHGLSREDFDDDPDFAEDYKSGMYDVQCSTCNGRGKVQDIEDVCEHLADAAEDRRYRMMESGGCESGMGDWRYGGR